MKTTLLNATLLVMLATACSGGGTLVYDFYTTPGLSSTQFVNALNRVDGAPVYNESEIVLYTDETTRSQYAGEDDWFVIWDAEQGEYKSVNLDYLRTITYFDYYSNARGTAQEFRDLEENDILNGLTNGDFWGDKYETSTYLGIGFDGLPEFRGQVSGLLYEDKDEVYDVSMMSGEKRLKQIAQQASNISYLYNIDMKKSLSMVTLGQEVGSRMAANGGELTTDDQKELLSHITTLSEGTVTLEKMMDVAQGKISQEQAISDFAKSLGSNSTAIKHKFLPEMMGIDL